MAAPRSKDMTVILRDAFSVDPRAIEVEPGFNVRDFTTAENVAHVAALKKSIRDIGVKAPLTIRRMDDGRILLCDGECRLRAVMELIAEGVPIDAVPCQADEQFSDEATRTADLVVRNSGRPLTMPEQGAVYRRLLGWGWTEGKIATYTGYSGQHVRECLLLVCADMDIQKMVHDGEVSATAAVRTLRREGPAAVEVLSRGIAAAKASGKRKVSEAALKQQERERNDPYPRLNGREVAYLIETLQWIAREEEGATPVELARTALERMGLGWDAMGQEA